MEGNDVKKKQANFWLGLLIGAAISSIVSLLYAPYSGAETRALIGEKVKKTRDRATDTVDRAKLKLSELGHKAAAKSEELQSRVQ